MTPFTSKSNSGDSGFRAAGLQAEGLNPVIDRLAAVLDEENKQILSKAAVDYRDFNLKKSRALLELTSLRPLLDSAGHAPELAKRLSGLIATIEKNSYLLGIQVSATRKVSELMARAIKEGQSDGTYSEFDWRDDE